MEYNFSLFFGLAVQAYEATLVSDDTPFDRFLTDPVGTPLSAAAERGRQIFFNVDPAGRHRATALLPLRQRCSARRRSTIIDGQRGWSAAREDS